MANGEKDYREHRRCYEDGGVKRCYDIRVSTLGALAIIIANICLLTVLGHFGNVFLAIASIGVVTFVGVLALADYVSIESSISTGEMRSAITASIVVVYLVVVAFAFSGEALASTASALTVIQHFTYVVGIVVIFYFGSKAVLQYTETAKNVTETAKNVEKLTKEIEKLKTKEKT